LTTAAVTAFEHSGRITLCQLQMLDQNTEGVQTSSLSKGDGSHATTGLDHHVG
jgi:hypothetical protein